MLMICVWVFTWLVNNDDFDILIDFDVIMFDFDYIMHVSSFYKHNASISIFSLLSTRKKKRDGNILSTKFVIVFEWK